MSEAIEWRHPPEVEYLEDGRTISVAVLAREFTRVCGRKSHEPRYCHCILNYGVMANVRRELLSDLGDSGAQLYLDALRGYLLSLVSGPNRRLWARYELQPIAVVDYSTLGSAVPLPFCRRCHNRKANRDNGGFCTVCEVAMLENKDVPAS